MTDLRKELADEPRGNDKPPLALAPIREEAPVSRQGERKEFNWHILALSSLCLALVMTAAVALFAFNRVGVLSDQLTVTMDRMERKTQQLDSSISFDSKRRYLGLGIRDEILEINPKVSLNEAYEYSIVKYEPIRSLRSSDRSSGSL